MSNTSFQSHSYMGEHSDPGSGHHPVSPCKCHVEGCVCKHSDTSDPVIPVSCIDCCSDQACLCEGHARTGVCKHCDVSGLACPASHSAAQQCSSDFNDTHDACITTACEQNTTHGINTASLPPPGMAHNHDDMINTRDACYSSPEWQAQFSGEIGRETGHCISQYVIQCRGGFRPDILMCLCSDPSYLPSSVVCKHTSSTMTMCTGDINNIPIGMYDHTCNQTVHYIDRMNNLPSMNENVEPHWIHDIYNNVKMTGIPNVMGAQMPLPTSLNLQHWHNISTGHPDDMWLLDCVAYGFPLQFCGGSLCNMTVKNHLSSTDKSDAIHKYLRTEMDNNNIVGPLPMEHFKPIYNISPIMTKEKSTRENTG